MDHLVSEFRQVARSLARSPGLVAMATLAIGLGVGATTTMFSITHGILRDLPFDEADRIIAMELEDPRRGFGSRGLTADEILVWRGEQRTLDGLAAYRRTNTDLSGEGIRAVRTRSAAVTLNTFRVLRVQPLLGRTWTEADLEEARPGILLSHDLWESAFGSDPEIIGRNVELSGTPRPVLGVMPEGFGFPSNEDVWEPIDLSQGGTDRYSLFGRLMDDVDIEAARAEFQGLEARNAIANPDVHAGMILRFDRYIAIQLDSAAEVRVVFRIMLLIVSFVLLIACANVANLLLARAVAMSRKSAVRVALGASRRRIVFRFLMDATIVATFGGVFGVGIAYVGVAWFNGQIGDDVGRFWMHFAVDRTVLLFALTLVCGAGLAAGILPGVRAAEIDVGAVLKAQAGRGGLQLGRASRLLIGGEVAMSCALLLLAGLMVKGVSTKMKQDVDFDTTKVVSVQVTLRNDAYPDRESRTRYFSQAIDALHALPSVVMAATATSLAGTPADTQAIAIQGEDYGDAQAARAALTVTSAGLLETLGLRVTRGRGFLPTDGPGAAPVALVSESFLAKRFPDGGGLGSQIALPPTRSAENESAIRWRTIVGVVPDAGIVLDGQGSADLVVVPATQLTTLRTLIVVRVRGDAWAAVPPMLDALQAVDASVPLEGVRPLNEVIRASTLEERTFGSLFMVFGSIALLLASVGLYGVVAFTVSQGVREVGIRMALGAEGINIVRHYVRQSLTPVLLGVVAGLGVGGLLAPFMGEVLMGSDPHDPMIFSGVPVILLAAGLLASVLPVLRVLVRDPIRALRQQ